MRASKKGSAAKRSLNCDKHKQTSNVEPAMSSKLSSHEAESAAQVLSYASRNRNETVPIPPKTMLGRREGLLSGLTPPVDPTCCN